MVKISFTVVSGVRHDTLYDDWSTRPTDSALENILCSSVRQSQ
jgi:hypothetical protein